MRINPKSKLIHHQEKSNWCWAAAASHVSDCIAGYLDQCQIASISLPACTGNCSSTACNIPYYLDRALSMINHFNSWHSGQIPVEQIKYELANGRPVCVRIGWGNGTNGHFVVIVGYSVSNRKIPFYLIYDPDPKTGFHAVKQNAFRSSYKISGYWSESILTE